MPDQARPPGAITRFNEWLAVHAMAVFGSMWAFYVFLLYGVLPIVDPAHAFQYLNWSNWAQLWSLPLLMVGQSVLGRAAERRAAETHDAVMEELGLLRDAHAELARIVADQNADALAGGEA
jgi:hypothetical protein